MKAESLGGVVALLICVMRSGMSFWFRVELRISFGLSPSFTLNMYWYWFYQFTISYVHNCSLVVKPETSRPMPRLFNVFPQTFPLWSLMQHVYWWESALYKPLFIINILDLMRCFTCRLTILVNNNNNNNNNNNDNLYGAVTRSFRYKGALQATTLGRP